MAQEAMYTNFLGPADMLQPLAEDEEEDVTVKAREMATAGGQRPQVSASGHRPQGGSVANHTGGLGEWRAETTIDHDHGSAID
jgi:hypothetical protein